MSLGVGNSVDLEKSASGSTSRDGGRQQPPPCFCQSICRWEGGYSFCRHTLFGPAETSKTEKRYCFSCRWKMVFSVLLLFGNRPAFDEGRRRSSAWKYFGVGPDAKGRCRAEDHPPLRMGAPTALALLMESSQDLLLLLYQYQGCSADRVLTCSHSGSVCRARVQRSCPQGYAYYTRVAWTPCVPSFVRFSARKCHVFLEAQHRARVQDDVLPNH